MGCLSRNRSERLGAGIATPGSRASLSVVGIHRIFGAMRASLDGRLLLDLMTRLERGEFSIGAGFFEILAMGFFE